MFHVDPTEIAIKYNTEHAACHCILCNGITYPVLGPELFLAESYDPVCRACGAQYAPELFAMLQAWERATGGYDMAPSPAPMITPSA